jgi:hypothetical protein
MAMAGVPVDYVADAGTTVLLGFTGNGPWAQYDGCVAYVSGCDANLPRKRSHKGTFSGRCKTCSWRDVAESL